MRRFRGHERGLAEIVGTLMLVLIVVVAVTAFAAFVASYQAQLQKQQAAAHQRSLEDIRILSVSTVLNTSNGGANYSSLSFVAGSLDINTMIVNEVTVNGQFINYYTVTPLGGGTTLQVCPLCVPKPPLAQEFNLTSLEQVTIKISLSTWNNFSNPHGGFLSFYNLASFGPTDFVSISLYTTLGNDFNRVFTAPTAVALTEQSETYSGGAYIPAVVFDGSSSIVPVNDSIVSWSWSISNQSASCFALALSGEKALVPLSDFPYGTYSVVLTVTDSNGLGSTANVSYVSTTTTSTPAVTVCPSEGTDGSSARLTGTGFTPSTSVTVTFASSPLTFTSCWSGTLAGGTTITTPSSGVFVCTFDVPSESPGPHSVVATDADSQTATTTFTVLPTIAMSPAQGPGGAAYTVTGSGFSVSSDATVTFDGTSQAPNGGSDCAYAGTTITTDMTGDFVCTFAVPAIVAGAYPVIGDDLATSTASPAELFSVTVPSITLSPTAGSSGTSVTAAGTGFTPGTTVTFAIGIGASLTSGGPCVANGAGAFSGCMFTVSSATPAVYAITASGSDVLMVPKDMASTTFTVTS